MNTQAMPTINLGECVEVVNPPSLAPNSTALAFHCVNLANANGASATAQAWKCYGDVMGGVALAGPGRFYQDNRQAVPSWSTETAGTIPRWFNYVEKRLNILASRPEGNEVEGYPKPSAEAIANARDLSWRYFKVNTPTPSVVPSEDRGVEMIWYKGGWHVEVTVGAEETTVWAHNLGTGDLWYGSLNDRSQELRQLLEGLSGLD